MPATGDATAAFDPARLAMPIGEAMFSQRAIRRLRPDPIPMADVRAMLEAAVKAPSGGNQQWARFLVLNDPERIREFGQLYHEAWWAKRRDIEGWSGPQDIPAGATVARSAMRLAGEIGAAPLIVLVLAEPPGPANSVITCAQNLMLAARALGIGSVPTTLHPDVMERVYALFDIPSRAVFHLCIPMGYPRGNFGPTARRPTAEVSYLNTWGAPVPWA
ncbi:MAG: nitroreductase family protein [Chloroflexi bacterium]|nr:nitroreductase family protein [Chloroflexota bacterium]